MTDTERLIDFLSNNTALTKDVDLFYLDIPVDTSGIWLQDAQINSRFNSPNEHRYNIYLRDKTKQRALNDLDYFKNKIEELRETTCLTSDGKNCLLEILYTWDYLEKDSNGFYVFTNTLKWLVL